MSPWRDIVHLHAERGAVTVLVAICLPVLVLFASLAIDAGNWFVHKRHLQIQADAGVLAGASKLSIGSGCDAGAVQTAAQQYAGAVTGSYNQFHSVPLSRVHMQPLNSATYYGAGNPGPVDTDVNTAGVCSSPYMVDVKMTETDVPWLLRAATPLGFINAHARASLQQVDTEAGILPVTVEDPSPVAVQAIWVNEATGAVVQHKNLPRDANPPSGTSMFDNVGDAVTVPINSARIGVRFALSGKDFSAANGNVLGDGTADCAAAYVRCYDGTSSSRGVLFIHGYSTTGSADQPASPIVRDVQLQTLSCSDSHFTDTSTGACGINALASVDFGSNAPAHLPAVKATLVDSSGSTVDHCDMQPQDQNDLTWKCPSTGLQVPPSSGPLTLNLHWFEGAGRLTGKNGNLQTCTTNQTGNQCQGDFLNVQRIFSATDDGSGPISQAYLEDSTGVVRLGDSFPSCSTCSQSLVASVVIHGLENSSKLWTLRVSDPQNNQSLDCDPAKNTKAELATGCTPQFTKNTGQVCPGSTATLFSQPEPHPCVGVQPGATPNDIPAGLDARINGNGTDEKAPCVNTNNWPNYAEDDPRIVQVILTPFGSLSGPNGDRTVPILDFGSFYVAGYSSGNGQGFIDPCEGDGKEVPVSGTNAVRGYFIKHVAPGGNGSHTCVADAFGTCVVQLTR